MIYDSSGLFDTGMISAIVQGDLSGQVDSKKNSVTVDSLYTRFRIHGTCFRGKFHITEKSTNYFWVIWNFPLKNAFHVSGIGCTKMQLSI